MSILQTIDSHEKLKALSLKELNVLCSELREFLITNVARTGGHLASNLGVVELTVALHRVYDTAVDRVVFDVGHQCYTHKILTGRRERFNTLRCRDGLAGFPKPCESVHDAFIAGHASTSISAALGIARAGKLTSQNYNVAAVIGDGAITGGMAYEALADAGQSNIPFVVILNDNGMSINRNVGGMSKHLANLRNGQNYFKLKKNYHKLVVAAPPMRPVDKVLRKLKTAVKEYFFPSSLFESMGFVYLGPADGHDIQTLIRVIRYAKEQRRPVLIHVNTVKGKGYSFAEENPAAFHGVSEFNVDTGRETANSINTFSKVMGQTVLERARHDNRICAITAAMSGPTGLGDFAREIPERFFDVGICEQHAVTMAAGMAKQGMRPVCAIYSTFLQRSFDQIIHDVAIERLPVIFAVDRAGLVGDDGETHHGIFDAAFLNLIPNMTVFAPASFDELRSALEMAFQADGPVAIRYPRGGQGIYRDNNLHTAVLREGSDVTLVTYGTTVNAVLEAAGMLEFHGINACVVKLTKITPTDMIPLGKKALFIEEIYRNGSLGEQYGKPTIALDGFMPHGSVEELRAEAGLNAAGIVKKVLDTFSFGTGS